jgi:hypothetical protein
VSIERTYYCDGPDCGDGRPCHVRTATPPPHLPPSFLEVRGDREGLDQSEGTAHFCSWDCLMRYAAARPQDERIEWDDLPPASGEAS